MLRFKARPRKDPALGVELTPSQRRVMRTLSDARQKAQKALRSDRGEMLRLLSHAPLPQILRAVPVDPWQDIQRDIQAELLQEVVDAGRRVKLPPIRKATVNFRFDDARPEAARWASKEAGTLIQNITNDQLAFVRDVVSRASMGEMTPAQAARVFRQMEDGMGLTVQQSEWVENFRQARITDGLARGLSLDAAQDAAEGPTAKYADRVYRYRTETIARTEILRASNEGRREAWAQGVEGGWISPDSLKVWSVEEDGRECEICAELGGLDPIPLGQEFPEGDPPVHPNCRCTVVLTDEIPPDLLSMTDDELEAEIERLTSEGQGAADLYLSALDEERVGATYQNLPREKEWLETLSDEEREALRDYTGKGGHMTADYLNDGLRSGTLTEAEAARVDLIDGAIQRAESFGIRPDGPLFRGERLDLNELTLGYSRDDIQRRVYEIAAERYPVGSEITFGRGSFISTSTDTLPALNAATSRQSPGIIFEISPTPGAPLQSLTAFDDEYEILLPRGKKFRVVAVHRDQQIYTANLDETRRTVVQLVSVD